MSEPLVVINPRSGSTNQDDVVALLRGRLGSFVLVEFPPDDPVRAVQRALDTHEPDLVYVCGGDGTVSAVAAAVGDRTTRIAVLPGGTANLLARSLGTPSDLGQALEALEMGELTRIDTMQCDDRTVQCDDRTILCRAAVGDFAAPGHETPSQAKRRLGAIAYPAWSLERALRPSPREFRLDIDGEVTTVRASSLVVANVPLVGLRNLEWAREASPTDGVVEIIALHTGDMAQTVETLWTTARSGEVDGPQVSRTTARENIAIDWEGAIEGVLDGEPCELEQLRLEVLQGGLRVMAPATETTRVEEVA